MKQFSLTDFSVSEIGQLLRDGATMIYPTETVAGIGTIGSDEDSVKKVFEIKHREWDKPVSYAFSSWYMASRYVEINPRYSKLIELFPGPITLILPLKPKHPPLYGIDGKSLGVRVPDVMWLQKLITFLDEPIISTSANVSGNAPATTVQDLDPEMVGQVDILMAWTDQLGTIPSTVVDLCSELTILREGAIPNDQFQEYL